MGRVRIGRPPSDLHASFWRARTHYYDGDPPPGLCQTLLADTHARCGPSSRGDISQKPGTWLVRGALAKGTCNPDGSSRVFAVGDDWQSIFNPRCINAREVPSINLNRRQFRSGILAQLRRRDAATLPPRAQAVEPWAAPFRGSERGPQHRHSADRTSCCSNPFWPENPTEADRFPAREPRNPNPGHPRSYS